MGDMTYRVIAKPMGKLGEKSLCEARVGITVVMAASGNRAPQNFRVLACSAKHPQQFIGISDKSFFYETIFDDDQLILVELPNTDIKLFRCIYERGEFGRGETKELKEAIEFPKTGSLVSVEDDELVIGHKSSSGCFQSAEVRENEAYRVVPDKRMMLWYLLGKISSSELRIISNIYTRNKHCL